MSVDAIKTPVFAMLAATFLYTLMQALVKAVSGIPFYEVVFFRGIVSLAICFVVLKRKKALMMGSPGNRHILILRGVFGTIGLGAFYYGITKMPLASASTFMHLSPLFAVLIAVFLLGESIGLRQLLCFVLAVIGIAMVKGFDPRVALQDMLWVILAALSAAMAYNMIRKLKDREDPMVIIFYFPLLTVPTALCIGLIFGWVWPQPTEWVVLLSIGVITQMAQYFMTWAYQHAPAREVAHINYLGPVLAIAAGWIFFGENMPWQSVAGIGLILFSVLILQKLKKPKTNSLQEPLQKGRTRVG